MLVDYGHKHSLDCRHFFILALLNVSNLLLKLKIQHSQHAFIVFGLSFQLVLQLLSALFQLPNFSRELLNFIVLLSDTKAHVVQHLEYVLVHHCF